MDTVLSEFPEIDIETTITVGLYRFHNRKMELPLEVQLTPPGLEAEGWRRWAIKVLQEAKARKEAEVIYVH